jgi:hypothetical protein
MALRGHFWPPARYQTVTFKMLTETHRDGMVLV